MSATDEDIARTIWENIAQLTDDIREVSFEQILTRPRHEWIKGTLMHAAKRVRAVVLTSAKESTPK